MKSKIIEKLKHKFTQVEFQESDAVYILVELCKFLEQENNKTKKKFKFILFYRDWVCHHSLDRNYNLGYFFKDIVEEVNKKGIDPYSISDSLPRVVNKFFPGRLKDDLENFSNTYLDGVKMDWLKFREQLYNVLIDQSLSIPIMTKELTFKLKKPLTEDLDDSLDIEVKVDNAVINAFYNDVLLNSPD